MLFLKAATTPSFLCVLTLFFNVTFLTLIHNRSSVQAADPDLSFDDGPDDSDYPDDKAIRQAFLGVARDKGVVFADLGKHDATEAKVFAQSRGLTWIYDAFRSDDGTPFLFANGRSSRWYGDFILRLTRFWIDQLSGIVWLVTTFPDGPRVLNIYTCTIWWYIELPLLQANEKVRIIKRVDRQDFSRTNIYLDKDDNDPFGSKKRVGGDPPRLSGGNGGSIFGVGVGAGAGLMEGVAGTGVGAGVGAARNLVPGLYLPSSGGDGSKDSGNGVTTDVVGNIIGYLPPVDLPAGTDEQQAMAEKDGAVDAVGIYKRGRNPSCYDWSDEPKPDFPTFPGDPRLTTYTVGISDPRYYDMARGGWAVIQVTQYAKTFPLLHLSDDYKLDVEILNPANHNQLLGSVMGANAPQDQRIKIVSLLPFALFVWTDDKPDDPLHFQYGEFGKEWEGDDDSPEHQCKFDGWTAEKRTGSCKFQYG